MAARLEHAVIFRQAFGAASSHAHDAHANRHAPYACTFCPGDSNDRKASAMTPIFS